MMNSKTPQYEMAEEIAINIVTYGELYQQHPDKVARIYGAMKDVQAILEAYMAKIRADERLRDS